MNTKLFRNFTLMAALLLLVTACDHIPALSGSGNLISDTREVSGFEKVEFDSVGSVEIIQDETESVIIKTDDDVMEHVTAEVREGTLYVGRDLVSPTPTRLNIVLHVNELTGISVPGIWDVHSDSLAADQFAIKIDGTGTVRIKLLTADELAVLIGGAGVVEIAGQVNSQTINVTGKSVTYRAGDLQSEASTIVGRGEFTLWATETLDMKIDGACILDYYGDPVIRIGQAKACEIRRLGER